MSRIRRTEEQIMRRERGSNQNVQNENNNELENFPIA